MSKPDYGKFSYNARDWKIFPKSKAYDDNFDKIFRKCSDCYWYVLCMKNCDENKKYFRRKNA